MAQKREYITTTKKQHQHRPSYYFKHRHWPRISWLVHPYFFSTWLLIYCNAISKPLPSSQCLWVLLPWQHRGCWQCFLRHLMWTLTHREQERVGSVSGEKIHTTNYKSNVMDRGKTICRSSKGIHTKEQR